MGNGALSLRRGGELGMHFGSPCGARKEKLVENPYFQGQCELPVKTKKPNNFGCVNESIGRPICTRSVFLPVHALPHVEIFKQKAEFKEKKIKYARDGRSLHANHVDQYLAVYETHCICKAKP